MTKDEVLHYTYINIDKVGDHMNLRLCANGHYYDSDRFSGCPICMDMETGKFPEPIPEKYQKLGEISYIGSGSVSRVYKISGEQDYALKVISCPDDRSMENAICEIQIMEKLRPCPGVILLLDSEVVKASEGGRVYILEEYGTPLDQYLNRNSMRYTDRIHILEELCDALIQCRNLGVLHRDIKPQNIFLNKAGRVCLGDFGVSAFLSDAKDDRHIIGTYKFMAPEIYSRGLIGEQSEIYSVGMMLYRFFDESKTARTAHDDEQKLQKRFAGEPLAELKLKDLGFQQTFMKAVWKICAFDTAQRPASFEELKDILHELWIKAKELERNDADGSIVLLDPIAVTVAMSMMVTVARGRQNGFGRQNWPKASNEPITVFERADRKGGISGRTSGKESYAGHPGLWDYDDEDALTVGGDALANEATELSDLLDRLDREQYSGRYSKTEGHTVRFAALYCRNCGAYMPENGRFCPHCGHRKQTERRKTEIQKIQISAIAPKKFRKGDYSMIHVVLYEEAFRNVVETLKSESDQEVTAVAKVPEDARIRVCLSSPDVEIRDNDQEGQWYGEHLEFGFGVFLPVDYHKPSIYFHARVYINGIIASNLNFTATCVSMLEQKLTVKRQDVLSAFVSYASQDRDEVLRIVQGMRKARQDMHIFTDIEGLRSGENWQMRLYHEIDIRDVLFLCWSRSARDSEWVDREWRYALKQKGDMGVDPLPLEPAEVCPPPKELEGKHFNDMLNYVRKNRNW